MRGSPDLAEPAPPRWARVYLLLAGFDVLTVVATLFLTHQIMGHFQESVAANRAWALVQHDLSELGQVAAAVNAPGNDVFATRRIEAEAARMEAARDRFEKLLKALRAEIDDRAGPDRRGPVARGLDQAGAACLEMVREARGVFAALSQKRLDEAAQRMAAMDRQYDRLLVHLTEVRQRTAAIQRQLFEDHTARAETFQVWEWALAGSVIVMVGAAVLYGRRLARQAEIQARQEREARARSSFLRRWLAVEEEERRRLARDLHDEIGRSLTTLLVGLRSVADASDLETARRRAAELREVTVATGEEVRRLARGLRPSALDDLGLVPALERRILDFGNAQGIEAELRAGGLEGERLPDAVKTALFRIVQEALTNAARHARARRVIVTLSREAGSVRATIEDDGPGLDVSAALTEATARGRLGLTGMRERAILLDGRLDVVSQPGLGTRIEATIPLGERGDDPSEGADR